MCPPVFTAALFAIATIWKQPIDCSLDEWIKKCDIIYIPNIYYLMENYSTIKNNESLPFATIWTDLESIMLSEINQTERHIPYDLTYM